VRRPRETNTEHAAGERQQKTLREHEPRESSTPGAQCDAHGELATACPRAAQQQVRHVGARDQQERGDGSEQHFDRPRLARIHHVLRPDRPRTALRLCAPRRRPRCAGRHAVEDILKFLRRLRRRNARTQPGVGVALRERVETGRNPHARRRVAPLAARRVIRDWQPHRRWRDPDDDVRVVLPAAHNDGLADDVGPAAVRALPKPVTDHGDARASGALVLRREIASDRRRNAEQVQVVRRDRRGNGIALGRILHRDVIDVHRGDRFERVRARAPRVYGAAARRREAVGLSFHRQHHDAVAVAVRERCQQQAVHHAEDGGVRPDPEGEREHDEHRELRMLPQEAQRESNVLLPLAELVADVMRASAPRATLRSVRMKLVAITEPAKRGDPGVRLTHAERAELFNAHVEVDAHLVGQLALDAFRTARELEEAANREGQE
jgi:hypothetical protein